MMETLVGGLFMGLGVAGWKAIARRSGDVLHPLGLLVLFWLLAFGFGHWDVAVTYDEPYYALPFELATYGVVLGALLVFGLGYWLVDPGLPPVDHERWAARLRGSMRSGPLCAVALFCFAAATATTLYFIRLAGEIPLFSPRILELRVIWKRPVWGYVYDLHYVVALFAAILADRSESRRGRLLWAAIGLSSIVQLALGAVRLSPLTGVVWAAVYIFYRRVGRVRIRHLVLLAAVVFAVSSVIEYYRRTPIRLDPTMANQRLDLSLSATLWGHTGVSFKNLQLSLERHPPYLGLGSMSYDLVKTLEPGYRARESEHFYRYGVHNTATFLLVLYMDFGIFGLLVMPGAYGAATALVYRQFRRRPNVFWLIVQIEFLIAVVLAFRTHKFFGNSLIVFGLVALAAHVLAGTRSEDELEREAARGRLPLAEGATPA